MGLSARGAVSIASVLLWTLLTCTHEAACGPLQGGDLCRGCVAGGGEEGCVWCDLPQLCVPVAHVRDFGAASCFANARLRHQNRRLLDDNECHTIGTKDLCSRVDYCKWCRSEILDDTCFGTAEAARLPRTIFLCSDVS